MYYNFIIKKYIKDIYKIDEDLVMILKFIVILVGVAVGITKLVYESYYKPKTKSNMYDNDDIDERFETIYSNMLRNLDLKHLNKLRANAMQEYKRGSKEIAIIVCCILGAFAIMSLLIVGLTHLFKDENAILYATAIPLDIFVLTALILGTIWSKKMPNKKSDKKIYEEQYKGLIIPTFLNQFKEEIIYKPNEKINRAIYDDAEFEKYDSYDSEDIMQITVQSGIHLTMGEIQTLYMKHVAE